MDDRGTPSYGNQMIPDRTSSQDTGATFWNDLEEETELYDGREGDLLAVPWCEALKVNTCGVNMKILGFIYRSYLHIVFTCIYILYIYIYIILYYTYIYIYIYKYRSKTLIQI